MRYAVFTKLSKPKLFLGGVIRSASEMKNPA